MALTNRQLDVLDFIKRFIADNGYSPTVREIASGMGLKSPSSVQDHLRSLVKNGIITTGKQKSRTIELLVQNEYLKDSETTVNIPILENAYKDVTKEFIEIPILMLNGHEPRNIYAYKKDNSTYLISINLCQKDRPSLTINEGIFLIEEKPQSEIFGNIISEFKVY